MEAHEGSLRALALTADGAMLATASEKGTVLRVWNVSNSQCLHEFRRGVERATITCLAWSWDHAFLCCVSDKGTAHVFQLEPDETTETTATGTNESVSATASITNLLLSSVRKSVHGEARKSMCQIRGVPHPQACSFVAAAPHVIAIAGWDADGNGVLLLSEFYPVAKRRGYHVLCKAALHRDESEEARRRRRLRGWTPEIPATPEGGRLYVGERVEVLEKGMDQIQFDEGKDDEEFVSVWRKEPEEENNEASATTCDNDAKKAASEQGETTPNGNGEDTASRNSTIVDSGTVGDSVRTEPLDDEPDSSDSTP